MELLVKRQKSKGDSTLGELYVDGKFECYTLEDVVREVPNKPVAEWKIKGKTAIPQGTYDVIISLSARFKTQLPEVLNVPGFSGIRIHSGNCAADTEGCLLLGTAQNASACTVANSRNAFNVFFLKLDAALKSKHKVQITYKNG